MVSNQTLTRYIQKLDSVISSNDVSEAKELQNEILAVFNPDLEGLKSGLTNYGFIGAFTDGHTGKTTVVGGDVDYIKDAKTLRSRLQAEVEKLESQNIEEQYIMRTEIFISHRSIDAPVADMLKDFLVSTGISNEIVFCSSLPGNDVNERINPEVRIHLKKAAINILILSRDYYRSAYCLNEAGVAWYLDEALVIPIGLPEIDHNSMIGFLNSDYKLRRLDNDGDISYLYDQAQEKSGALAIKHSVVTQEILKLKEKYRKHIENRGIEEEIDSNYDNEEKHSLSNGGVNSSDNFEYLPIQLHACVMLFFAAEEGGEIKVLSSLSGRSYIAGKHPLNASNEHRELAKWDAAVDELQNAGYIKTTGNKERIYEVTEKGYNISESFKNDNELNAGMSPSQILDMFE